MTLINFLIQQHNYPLPHHTLMWSVSGIFLNAQKVITTPHYSVLTGIKSGNKRRSIFKTTSSKKLQKYRNSTRSESAKTWYFNKKQLVLTAEKCLQQLFIC